MRITPIPSDLAARIRTSMSDDFGNTLTVTTRGRGPCRSCLRMAGEGTPLILFAYQPFQKNGNPYAETGPVFIHAETCETYARPEEFPPDFAARTLTLRSYDEAGNIVDALDAEPGDRQTAVEQLFSEPLAAYIHARNPAWGCYNFRIDRN